MNAAATEVQPPDDARDGPGGVWRPKGYLGARGLTLVLALLALTLAMSACRLLALPGAPLLGVPGVEHLRHVGELLDQSLTLVWVPSADRNAVIYLLLLPTAALLITLARLTFGLRVLGYRSVLIAVGFHEIGILPSLLVISVVVGIIILLRPSMRRVRLPLYARVSMILGITACILVSALLIGAWQRSEMIWSLAFFPVIILAMMAEAIAGSLDQGNAVTAAWRLLWTLVVAFVLFALMSSAPVVDTLARFPELMVTQLLLIVLVSEYLDFRLLQDWQNTLGVPLMRLLGRPYDLLMRKPRVAVVRNRWQHGVVARLGVEAPAGERGVSAQHLIDALRDEGYLVKVFEGDMTLLRELRSFLAPHPRTGAPGGLVLNLSPGIQGRGRRIHAAAMLEMAGLPYTGPDPLCLGLLHDRFALLSLLQRAEVPVSPFRLLRWPVPVPDEAELPVLLGPRCDFDGFGRRVRTPEQLIAAAREIAAAHGPELVMQPPVHGPVYKVGILGNRKLECLPLLRTGGKEKGVKCPAPVEEELADRLRECARRAFRAAGCRDYALVTLGLDRAGEPYVVNMEGQGILGRKDPMTTMAHAAGMRRGELAVRIVKLASLRAGTEWVRRPQIDNVVGMDRSAIASPSPRRQPGSTRAEGG